MSKPGVDRIDANARGDGAAVFRAHPDATTTLTLGAEYAELKASSESQSGAGIGIRGEGLILRGNACTFTPSLENIRFGTSVINPINGSGGFSSIGTPMPMFLFSPPLAGTYRMVQSIRAVQNLGKALA